VTALERPRPGHGTVFVMRMRASEWTASWHDAEVNALSEIWGFEAEVLAWARTRPAAEKLVFDWNRETYIPLPDVGLVDVGFPCARRAEAG
jgi:hypothetical protein